MTAITTNFENPIYNEFIADSNIYQVTAVTFDGEEITLPIEAESEEDAAEQVSAQVANVDYILF